MCESWVHCLAAPQITSASFPEKPFPAVKQHLKLPKGTANSISRNTFLNPFIPIIFCYPPVIKRMAMENPRSTEAGVSIETSQLHQTSAPDRIAVHGSSSQRLATPKAESGAAPTVAGSAGRWPGKKADGPAMAGGIPDSGTIRHHPAPHPASSNGSMPGRSVKVTYGARLARRWWLRS